MRTKITLIAASLVISSPALAQDYNGFVTLPQYDYSSSDMGWAYAPDRKYSAATVLARLRELCGSNNHYDQYYCARGMKVLKKAYVEYQTRKAAQSAIAQ